MKVRLQGLALLALCAIAAHRLHLLLHTLPRHEATLLEWGLTVIIVLTGLAGAALLVVGPPLFQPYTWPPPDRD